MSDLNADIARAMLDNRRRIERLEKIENVSLSDELAHALGAGIPASAGVALDASRHDHIHEITASSNPGAKVSFLQTDTNGELTLTRLQAVNLCYKVGSTLTISGDAITVTNSYHIIDTEGAAASDDLATINGNIGDGTMLMLHTVDSARDVVIKNRTLLGSGNILTDTGADLTMGTRQTYAYLHWDNARGRWMASIKIYS